MRGRSNHSIYLSDSEFVGNGRLMNYALFNLGYYPGIIRREGCEVIGEVFEVDENTKRRIDMLESEGSLYFAIEAEVFLNNNERCQALVYVYGHDVDESDYIPAGQQPWRLR